MNDLEIVAVVINAKLIAIVVFLLKTALLFELARTLSNWLASIWPGYDEWFNKGAIVAILVPWIWWATVPLVRAFGFDSTEKH